MWLLVTTLCLQMSATDAVCRRDVSGPYPERSECWERITPTEAVLSAVASEIGANVLFAHVGCEKGWDG